MSLLSTSCGGGEPTRNDNADARVLDSSVDAGESVDARVLDGSVDASRSGDARALDSSVDADASDTGPTQTHDAHAGDAHVPDAAPSDVCTSSGGVVASQLCCGAVQSFPDLCQVGACSCAPASSHAVDVCRCPNGQCFGPGGCQARPVCSPGADQTCNDSPAISSLHGHCETNGSCSCASGFAKNPTTGLCL